MNIWLINHYAVPPDYYPLARPTNFAKYLMKMGHQVTIFAASTVHNSDLNLITDNQKYKEDFVSGIHYVYIKCRDYHGNGLSRIFNMCEFALKLKGICDKFPKPDAIVSTSMPPMSCATGVRWGKKHGCKVIAEIADLWPESIVAYGIAGPKNPAVIWMRHLEKWIYKNADRVVFTMEGAYEYIKEQGWEKDVPRDKVKFINNGVDLEWFNQHRVNFKIEDEDLDNPDTFKVLYAGSIRKVNNVGQIVDAAKLTKNKKIVFLIWGDGDDLEMLKKRVIDENIENVKFKGKVSKSYVPYISSKCDLGVFHIENSTLIKYGLSLNKMFDYFAAGLPILTDCETEYNPAVQYKAGVAISKPDARLFAAEIERFFDIDKEIFEEYKQNALRTSDVYSFNNLTQNLISIIEGI